MSPRPRTVSDEDIIAAAERIVGRAGSAALTLADVGAEARLSPATIVQRFGSKRGLLLALAAASAQRVEAAFAQARAEFDSPVAALIAAASAVAHIVGAPSELASQLTFLQADPDDEEFRSHGVEHAKRARAGYRKLVEEALHDGELAGVGADELAGAIESIATGALLSWAIHREGDAATAVQRDVTTLLRGYGRGAWARP
jgi:AcrR family transcriptional regulator